MKSLLRISLLQVSFWTQFPRSFKNTRSLYQNASRLGFCFSLRRRVFGLKACVLRGQVLLNEVNGYGEKKTSVENTGCRLTELSRKEDCDVIHNLILTVQDRHKKLLQRTSERGRTLEDVKKHIKQVIEDMKRTQTHGGGE